MKEYDYSGFETPPKKTRKFPKDFASEEQRDFWSAFSEGAKEGEQRDFFTGNIQTMSAFLDCERTRENTSTRER